LCIISEFHLCSNSRVKFGLTRFQNESNEIRISYFIAVNGNKSSHITFTLRKENCPAISTSQTVLPQVESVKYLGLHFVCKLNWKEHIIKKRKQTDLKVNEIKWLIGRNSNLSLENKLLVYKAVIKPIWTYGIELWGCASKSNAAIIQRSQSKILRTIANAP